MNMSEFHPDAAEEAVEAFFWYAVFAVAHPRPEPGYW